MWAQATLKETGLLVTALGKSSGWVGERVVGSTDLSHGTCLVGGSRHLSFSGGRGLTLLPGAAH